MFQVNTLRMKKYLYIGFFMISIVCSAQEIKYTSDKDTSSFIYLGDIHRTLIKALKSEDPTSLYKYLWSKKDTEFLLPERKLKKLKNKTDKEIQTLLEQNLKKSFEDAIKKGKAYGIDWKHINFNANKIKDYFTVMHVGIDRDTGNLIIQKVCFDFSFIDPIQKTTKHAQIVYSSSVTSRGFLLGDGISLYKKEK